MANPQITHPGLLIVTWVPGSFYDPFPPLRCVVDSAAKAKDFIRKSKDFASPYRLPGNFFGSRKNSRAGGRKKSRATLCKILYFSDEIATSWPDRALFTEKGG